VTKFKPLFKATATGGVQVWEIWVTQVRGDAGCINVRYGLVDGKMQTKQEIVQTGKNLGKKNATTGYTQACAEAESRWNKQKDRKGYGLTADESAAVRAVLPMLAHKYPDHCKKVDWDTAFAQPKLDGFRCQARITPGGVVTLTSRENQPLLALSALRDAIAEVKHHISGYSGDVVLDGELYCHGMALNDISSACKKKSALTEKIRYHVYDAAMGDVDFQTRNQFARDVVTAAACPQLAAVHTVKVRSEADLMTCQAEFLDAGYEGAMLRYGKQGYQAGKRSDKLLKVKTFQDGEFEVVDYKFGRGTHAAVPVFVCQTPDGNLFDVTAPGTMEEKAEIGRNARAYVGRALTIKYAYYTKTAEPVPFQPVAKMFRGKTPKNKV